MPLAALTPLWLEVASGSEAVAEWNEFVARYHPLGYRQPIGQHLRYFLLDRDGRSLGCLLFDFAAVQLGCRDQWIGWQGQAHRKYLHLVVRNARYLLFPWVSVQHLASHALGLAARQLPDDWQRAHGSRPVLCETYVDPQLHRGTCYRAAGWQCLGLTTGARATASQPARTPKQVWVRPLRQDFRSILLNGPPKRTRQRREPASADASFVQLWQGLIGTLTRVASAYDREWVAPPADAEHTAAGPVRVPHRVHAGQPGLRHGAGGVVGAVPCPGPRTAGAAGHAGRDLPGPRQGQRGGLPAHPPRRARRMPPGPANGINFSV